MAGEWDKIQTSFKKLQPQIKKLDTSSVDKLIKQIKAAVETAWDAEDVFAATLKVAQEGGIKGKKLGDYSADKRVMSGFKILRKEGEKHEDFVEDLKKVSTPAVALHKELTKMLANVKKHINKKDKAHVKFQADLKSAHEKAKTIAGAMGKLTPAETFYGSRLDKVVDRVINKANKKGSGLSGDAAKLIEPKELEKNVKAAVKLAGQVAKLCDAAVKKADQNPKDAAPYLKKAAKLIKDLKELNTAYLTVKKKNAKLINASKDKAKILKVILTISKAHDVTARRFSEAMGEVRDMKA